MRVGVTEIFREKGLFGEILKLIDVKIICFQKLEKKKCKKMDHENV